jgi:hypothetical protein
MLCFCSNDISPDFECRVEVYAHKLFDDLSIASTPSKIKKKINDLSSSVGRSLGKRLSGLVCFIRLCFVENFFLYFAVHSQREEPEFMPNMLLGPKFDCIAHGELTLKNVGDAVTSHDLNLHNSGKDTTFSVLTYSTNVHLLFPADSSSSDVPLFGSYCCRLAAQPGCMVHDTTTGPLHVQVGAARQMCCQCLKICCFPNS